MEGYNVDTARTGKEAIKKLSNNKGKSFPNLILMDYRLPGIDGIETMIKILEIKQSANIVFFSADESVKERAISCGAKAFFTKPNSVFKLIEIIKDLK